MAHRLAMPRIVVPETLDELPEHDPRAIASRRDLRRVHRAMGTRRILVRAITQATGSAPPRRVLELGAGDGTLMLRVAGGLAARWPGVQLTLLDRQRLVTERTARAYGALGWQVQSVQLDVMRWIEQPARDRWDLVIANLFVHHFDGTALGQLLHGIAARTDLFVACEPRRGWLSLAGSRLVGLLGANAVTRGDAVTSVHAGFRDRELSAVWPAGLDWQLQERAAGPFSHCFVARRLVARRAAAQRVASRDMHLADRHPAHKS